MTELKIVSQKAFDEAYTEKACHFSKNETQQIIDIFKSVLDEPLKVLVEGKHVSLEQFIGKQKSYQFTSEDCRRLLALLIHDNSILKLFLSRLPQAVLDLMKILSTQKFISAKSLKTMGMENLLEDDFSQWYGKHREKIGGINSFWFSSVTAYSADSLSTTPRYYREDDNYFYLNKERTFIFDEVLNQMLGKKSLYLEEIPEGLAQFDAETEAMTAYPVIKGLIKQEILKFSTFKVTQASSAKVMKQLPVKDIIPDLQEYGQKYNIGQVYFPYLNATDAKDNAPYCDVVKSAVTILNNKSPETNIPNLLPFIKGFKANSLYYNGTNHAIRLIQSALEEAGELWVNLKTLSLLCIDTGSTLSYRAFSEMYLENASLGEALTPENLTEEVDLAIMQSYCSVLYGLGAATLLCGKENPAGCATPFDRILAVRLNPLGKYAFGLTKNYSAPEIEQEELFELDSRMLVIRSLKPGNPYESLLGDIALPIGGNRFRISPESFLAKCYSSKDVKDKIDFFKDYMCSEPPKVWTDFFETISRRCYPFKNDREEYRLYSLDPNHKELLRLISDDSVLRNIVIKAEGYRVLVPVSKSAVFTQRLKHFGYLV